MADRWQHLPIFYVDVQGFTTYNADTQQTIVRRVHDMATEAAREFIPDGDVWSTWRLHGTGDGYYFLLIGASPQVALQYALRFNEALEAHNAQHGEALTLRLYGALDVGSVELVDDQYQSEAFSRAARFLSHQPFKDYSGQQPHPLALAMSALFHTEWREDIARDSRFPATVDLQWTRFAFHDKHNYPHQGFVLGEGWERPTATPEARRTPGEVKIEVCRLLGDDWEELADHFGIQPHEKRRFAKGDEPRGVWEWLEVRRRLPDLPEALAAIGRDDLQKLFPLPR